MRAWPRRLNATGLIIGSIAPDFEYFILLRPIDIISHTLPGIFIFDLPLALILTILFHLVIKRPLIAHLPSPFDQRFAQWREADWRPDSLRQWLMLLVSIIIGALSHIGLDAFTHNDGFFVQHWAFLRGLIALGQFHMPIYDLLQYGFSLAGVLVVLIALLLAQRHCAPDHQNSVATRAKIFFWLIILSCAAIVGALGIGRLRQPTMYDLIIESIIATISGALLGLIVASLLMPISSKLRIK
jgi:hypothetical protein